MQQPLHDAVLRTRTLCMNREEHHPHSCRVVVPMVYPVHDAGGGRQRNNNEEHGDDDERSGRPKGLLL